MLYEFVTLSAVDWGLFLIEKRSNISVLNPSVTMCRLVSYSERDTCFQTNLLENGFCTPFYYLLRVIVFPKFVHTGTNSL